MCKRIVTGKYTIPVTFQDKTFIRMDDIFEIKLTDIQSFSGRINPVY